MKKATFSVFYLKAIGAILLLSSIVFLPAVQAVAQSERSLIRQGNQKYHQDEYALAEIDYRKATEKNNSKTAPIANFNLANSLYKQGRYEEAATQFEQISKTGTDKDYQSNAFYNMGNALLKAKKIPESIEAYKNALRRNPNHQDAKYNLAYAQKLKEQEEEQKQEQQNQDQEQQQDQQNEEQKQDEQQQQEQEQKDQQQKDQQQQDQQNKEQEQKDKGQQQQDQQNKEQQEQQQQQAGEEKDPKDEQQQQQLTERKLSKEETERLLEALKNEELKVQQKLKQRQGKATKTRVDKDW